MICMEKREETVRLGGGARGRVWRKTGKEPRTQAAWIIIALWANAEFRIILSEKGAIGEFETGQRHKCTCSKFFYLL